MLRILPVRELPLPLEPDCVASVGEAAEVCVTRVVVVELLDDGELLDVSVVDVAPPACCPGCCGV